MTQQARDAIVFFGNSNGNCSGTLISPTLVLTASHCIYGNTTTPFVPNPGTFRVSIGPNNGAFAQTHVVNAFVSLLTAPGPKNVSKRSRDLALLHLQTFELANAWAFRPTLASPVPTSPQPCSDPTCFPGGGLFDGLTFGVAGYAPGSVGRTTRQFRDLPNLFIQRKQYLTAGKEYPYWAQVFGDWNVELGDSGGALYILRSASQESFGSGQRYRDVVGVLSGLTATNDGDWADVTRDENKGWILAQVQQGTSPLAPPHSLKWNQSHGKTPTSWVGEVDYIGACDNGGSQQACLAGNGANGWDCDCDHWYDHGALGTRDNCPNDFNPDQADGLDNGVGDACRTCKFGDADGDGVCDPCLTADTKCATEFGSKPWKVDNCPGVKNADQANGNELAERSNHPDKIWGDVCDPVPHAKPEAQTREANTNCVTVVDPPIPPSVVPPGTTHQECTATILEDEIVARTVAPSPSTATQVQPVPVQIGESSERYCQSVLPTFQCDRADVVNDAQLTLWPSAAAERGDDSQRPWHRTTTRYPYQPAFAATRDRTLANWTYGVTQATNRWDFAADFAFWTADLSNLKIPLAPSCQTVDCLDGAYWFHAVTPIGNTTPTAGSVTVGLHGDNLANAYGPIHPTVMGISYCPAPPRALSISLGQKLSAPTDPGSSFPVLVWPAGTDGVRFANGIHSDSDALVPTSTGALGVLQGNGTAIVVGSVPNCGAPIASDGLNQLAFDPSVIWTSALEPPGIGGGPDAIAIAANGTSIRATASLSGTSLASSLVDCAVTGACGAGTTVPSPRTGFSAVYSRALAGVVIAGGTAGSTPTADVWVLPLDGAPVNVTPTTQNGTACPTCGEVKPVGTIRAVTYAVADQRLWLLDEVSFGKLTFVRLSRAPLGGSLEVLAVFPKLGWFDRSYLTLDRDGKVLATFARSGGPGFITARLDVGSTGLRVTGLARVPGAQLLAPPITSSRSYGFVIKQGQKISLERRASLVSVPPALFHQGL